VNELQSTIEAAARALRDADALLIGAGAGIGVDSGLPDFRGDEGFWNAYPPFREAGHSFVDMANPRWFARDPELGWGFYGHRLGLYRQTRPHRGFELLRQWAEQLSHGAFVFTSNVDGQFQRAGFDDERVLECHGSLNHLQCCRPCHDGIWSAEGTEVEVDEQTFQAAAPLPSCVRCGGLARPNVLMFGDAGWLGERAEGQQRCFDAWASGLERQGDARLVAVECGAGTAIPSVRWQCESLVQRYDGTLIRINPREPQGPSGTLSIGLGALAALEAIEAVP
jgi:NAD-dependent SIR2 family protein deacetylase